MTATTAAPASSPELQSRSAQGRWVLAACVGGAVITQIDANAVGIALPAIGRDFHTDLAPLQWVFTAYTLTLAGLLLVAGALGDRYGRRRIFTIGVVWFALASLLSCFAPTPGTLIGARALEGVGAALLTPGSLAILEAAFAPGARAWAIGAWSGLSGVAGAVGPFLGGWLVQAASWRWIFAINLPIAIGVVLVTRRHVPESRDPAATGRVDLTGGALVTLGLVGLTYGLIRGADGRPMIVVGGVLLAAFVAWERRTRMPILPLHLFASTRFTATNLVTFAVYAALGGALFLLPIALQQVAGYSPLAAGLALLPVTAMMLLLSSRSGALAARIGPRLQMSAGPVLVGAGLALFARIDAAGSYLTHVLPAVTVLGFGLAVTVAPLTATVLAAVPARHAGVASAVNNDVARAGSLIAVAVLPAAAGLTGAAYLDPGRFSAGFHTAALICAILCVLAGGLAAVTIGNDRPRRQKLHPPHGALDAPPPRVAG
ncbi:MFS transporter [Paractinoplanes globisporus]|uniref:MFS transporter n=1 Tax=Paractinoplanes globisporus TaxID=113565 RepID=A0ABW6W992_9ACTN|nr:MFS transporter [Actinoplanes globisporus]